MKTILSLWIAILIFTWGAAFSQDSCEDAILRPAVVLEELDDDEIEILEKKLKALQRKGEVLLEEGRKKDAEKVFQMIEQLKDEIASLERECEEEEEELEIEEMLVELHQALAFAAKEGDREAMNKLKDEIAQLQREADNREREIEMMEQEIAILRENAKYLEEKGRYQEAKRSAARAEELECELEALFEEEEEEIEYEGEEDDLEMMRDELRALHHELQVALQDGDEGDVHALKKAIHELERECKEAQEAREMEWRIQEQERIIDELYLKAEVLDDRGRDEDADRLREKAQVMAAELEDLFAQMEAKEYHKRKIEIEELYSKADHARRLGDLEEAMELYEMACDEEFGLVEEHEDAAREKAEIEIEECEEYMDQLFAEAEELEEEGEEEEARQRRREANRVAAKVDAFMQENAERHLGFAAERVRLLKRRAERARELGFEELGRNIGEDAAQEWLFIQQEREAMARERAIGSKERMIDEIMTKADRLDDAGKHESAEKLRSKGERLILELERFMERDDHKKLDKVEHKIQFLLKAAQAAAENEEHRKAQALKMEAKELEKMLKEEVLRRERHEDFNQEHAKLNMMFEAAAAAERKGEYMKAQALHDQAKNLARQLERKKMSEEQRRMRVALSIAEKEARHGRHQEALDARARAEKLQQELEMRRSKEQKEEMLLQEILELREEIRQLRKEMKNLKKKLPQRF